jgi:hypothetical protein
MTKKDYDFLEKFMGLTFDRIEKILVKILSIETIIFKNGLITQQQYEIIKKDSEDFPEQQVGKKVLEDMIKDFKNKHTEKE